MKRIEWTIIVLSCNNKKDKDHLERYMSLANNIEAQAENREGLKIYAALDYGKKNRLHYKLLVNRKIESNLVKKWSNDHVYLEFINTGHYNEILNYLLCGNSILGSI